MGTKLRKEGLVARTEAPPDTRLPNWYSEIVRNNTKTVTVQVIVMNSQGWSVIADSVQWDSQE